MKNNRQIVNWLDLFSVLKHTKDQSVPMYQQIVGVIKRSIQSSQLSANDRLPTNRQLSDYLKVDRSTVARAYLELQKEGLIESHVGRGTMVAQQNRGGRANSSDHLMLWSDKFSRASDSISSTLQRYSQLRTRSKDTIYLASGVPTSEFYPYADFEQIIKETLAGPMAQQLFDYSPVHGSGQCFAQVQKYLNSHSIYPADNELLITNGSQQGIDLVATTFINPDDVVLIEETTYIIALASFKASQARFIPIPVDQNGLRLDVLESVVSTQRAKLLYVMPNFQNPTGSVLSFARRQGLLSLARQHQLPILEDNYVGELHYEGAPPLSLKALDKQSTVVMHQGTFSKALCPALRLAYVVAPAEVMARLRDAKHACDLSTNTQAQVLISEYLRRGLYEKHLEEVRRNYKIRRDVMLHALNQYVDKRVTWSKPKGGMFVWAKLPNGYSASELLPFAEKEGVIFCPGDMFSMTGGHAEYFRLSFIQPSEDEIKEGIKRLGKAIKSYFASRQSRQTEYTRPDWRTEATVL